MLSRPAGQYAQSLGFNPKWYVEFAAEIFHCNAGSEFNDLRI